MSNKVDLELTVIDIVHETVWVLRVFNNNRATKAIAILKIEMRVVPERAGLVLHIEAIEE